MKSIIHEETVIDVTIIDQVSVSELPQVITSQLEKLNNLDSKVKAAIEKASFAQGLAEDALTKKAGFGHAKTAIEALQEYGYTLAEAVASEAEAQRIAFEFQTEIAKISKYLFALGVNNISVNRSVVRELEAKLRGASASELSELAKIETLNVIKQLKAQEDILNKHEQLEKNVKEIHNENIRQDKELESQAEVDKRHDDELCEQSETDKLHDRDLKIRAEIDARHDEMISALRADIYELKSKTAKMFKIAFAVGGVGILFGIVSLLMFLFS